MSHRHPASRVEDAVNQTVARRLAKRGWRLQVMPFTGYGGADFARIMGRVVLAKQGQPVTAPTADEAPARRGFRAFFTAPLADVDVVVRCGGQAVAATTDRGGYIDVEVRGHGFAPGWHTATITAQDVHAEAPVQIISGDARFGIISDIDDTCLITTLPRPMIAAWNTFVLEETARKVVPGMPAMYRSLLAADPQAPIVYLSTGAWNTQPILTRFFRRHGFPAGPLLLTDWGPTTDSIFRSGREHKRSTLRRLAREFPDIKWLLVGDDGQHDPVIYEEFALEQPEHVECIAIRQLTATQQMLSHGHPLARDDLRGRPVRVMVCEGPDGFALHRLVRKARAAFDELATSSTASAESPALEQHHA